MKSDENLDARLRAWAARREPGEDRLDALAGEIGRRAGARRPAVMEKAGTTRGWKLAYAMGGALAMALVCLAWEWMHPARAQQVPAGSDMRALYAEACRLFPEQLRWLAQSGGEVGLGVESANPKAIPQTPPVLVRLTVLSRLAPETRWREAWTTEIIARTEDLVEIVPSRQVDNRLTLWVYGLENGKLAVETDLRLEKPVKLASRLNGILNVREPAEMAAGHQGGMEYKVIQEVETVRLEGGPS